MPTPISVSAVLMRLYSQSIQDGNRGRVDDDQARLWDTNDHLTYHSLHSYLLTGHILPVPSYMAGPKCAFDDMLTVWIGVDPFFHLLLSRNRSGSERMVLAERDGAEQVN